MDAISILRGLKERYEIHHKVRIMDEAIIAAVELSKMILDGKVDKNSEIVADVRNGELIFSNQ